jgi:hypothetical protein
VQDQPGPLRKDRSRAALGPYASVPSTGRRAWSPEVERGLRRAPVCGGGPGLLTARCRESRRQDPPQLPRRAGLNEPVVRVRPPSPGELSSPDDRLGEQNAKLRKHGLHVQIQLPERHTRPRSLQRTRQPVPPGWLAPAPWLLRDPGIRRGPGILRGPQLRRGPRILRRPGVQRGPRLRHVRWVGGGCWVGGVWWGLVHRGLTFRVGLGPRRGAIRLLSEVEHARWV